MKPYPELRSNRLLLREFAVEDASDVQRLAGEWEVARTMLLVPHPYEDGEAEAWIATHRPAYEAGERITWAVVLRGEGALVGCIALHLQPLHDNAELGYWIGWPHWGLGYATEAAGEVVRHGFEDLRLHRVHSYHFGNNPASGKVLRKVGMRHEGTRPGHYKKWGSYEDRVDYGLLAGDWPSTGRK